MEGSADKTDAKKGLFGLFFLFSMASLVCFYKYRTHPTIFDNGFAQTKKCLAFFNYSNAQGGRRNSILFVRYDM